jgi:hypothetical protein
MVGKRRPERDGTYFPSMYRSVGIVVVVAVMAVS